MSLSSSSLPVYTINAVSVSADTGLSQEAPLL